MDIDKDKMKKIIILGFGLSGQSALKKLLRMSYRYFIVIDQIQVDLTNKIFESTNTECYLDNELLNPSILEEVEFCILSPGISPRSAALQMIKKKNLPVIAEMELGLRGLKGYKVVVSGSNGKSTTVSLIAHLLRYMGLKAQAVGNIGIPVSSIEISNENDIWIVEASSYQLEKLHEPHFDLGVILNISENHLDHYTEMEGYVKAKACIQNCLKKNAFLWVDEESYQKYSSYWFWPNLKIGNDITNSYNFDASFNINKQIATNLENGYKFNLSHEIKNVRIALAICKKLGIHSCQVLEGLRSYSKLPYRMETVGIIDKVAFINDSKSTSVAATLHALQSIDQPLVLIVGGVHKGASYGPWREELIKKAVAVLVIGQAQEQIIQEIKGCCPIFSYASLSEAVRHAFKSAKMKKAIVLFSPGCSSFDMFKNFEDRGSKFNLCIAELKAGGPNDTP
jgi:UDP-N-acetylmuramoylalanine--D-glutamate ligase